MLTRNLKDISFKKNMLSAHHGNLCSPPSTNWKAVGGT